MEYYVGLDVSLKQTSICVVDQTGSVVREGVVDSDPEAISVYVRSKAPDAVRIGLETGPTSTWLWTELKQLGLPVICIDARHAKAVLKMQINKSDRNDAIGIARIMQTGWFKEVHVKDIDSHSVRALLASRALLVKIKRDLENHIRGLLKNLGLVIGCAKFNVFAVRAEELIEGRPELIAVIRPLLEARNAVGQQVSELDKVDGAVARNNRRSAQRVGEEGAELRLAHLARGHRELAMTSCRHRIASDSQIVWRIKECRIDPRLVTNDPPQKFGIAAVTTPHPVISKDPDVAQFRSRYHRNLRDDLVIRIVGGHQDHIDLAGRKAGQSWIDVDINRTEFTKLQLKNLQIPAGIERNLVVGDPQRSLLGLGKTGQGDDWELCQAHQPGRLKPSVTRDNMTFGISENWICKAERLDRFAYLVDLALGVSARIARIGNEISDWTVGHDQPGGRPQCSYFGHAKTPPKANDRRGFAPFENANESVQGEGEARRVEPSAARGGCRASRVQVEAGFRSSRVQGEPGSGRGGFRKRRVQSEASSERGKEFRAKRRFKKAANRTSDGAAFYLADFLISDSNNGDQFKGYKCLMSRFLA
jgi:transposase